MNAAILFSSLSLSLSLSLSNIHLQYDIRVHDRVQKARIKQSDF